MAARNGTIGFAIPVNRVRGLLPQLAEKGKVEWGWRGVGIAEVGEDEALCYSLEEARGALIRERKPREVSITIGTYGGSGSSQTPPRRVPAPAPR